MMTRQIMMKMMTVGQVNNDDNDDRRTGQAKRMAGLPKSHIARGLPTGTARPSRNVDDDDDNDDYDKMMLMC